MYWRHRYRFSSKDGIYQRVQINSERQVLHLLASAKHVGSSPNQQSTTFISQSLGHHKYMKRIHTSFCLAIMPSKKACNESLRSWIRSCSNRAISVLTSFETCSYSCLQSRARLSAYKHIERWLAVNVMANKR